MRGADVRRGKRLSYVDMEDQIPERHPLRAIRRLTDDALRALSAEHFSVDCTQTGAGASVKSFLPKAAVEIRSRNLDFSVACQGSPDQVRASLRHMEVPPNSMAQAIEFGSKTKPRFCFAIMKNSTDGVFQRIPNGTTSERGETDDW